MYIIPWGRSIFRRPERAFLAIRAVFLYNLYMRANAPEGSRAREVPHDLLEIFGIARFTDGIFLIERTSLPSAAEAGIPPCWRNWGTWADAR